MPRIVIDYEAASRWLSAGVQIWVDGKKAEKLGPGSRRCDFSIAAGKHTLQAKAGRTASHLLHFNAGDRETLSFICRETGIFPRAVRLEQVHRARSNNRFGSSELDGGMGELGWDHLMKGDGEDWPTILGVRADASLQEIRQAYLKLIWTWHHDHIHDLQGEEMRAAENRARLINSAYAAARRKHSETG